VSVLWFWLMNTLTEMLQREGSPAHTRACPYTPQRFSCSTRSCSRSCRICSPNTLDVQFRFPLQTSNLPLIKDHPLRVLLNIFLGKELSDYQAWASSHADCMATYRTSPRLFVNELMIQCQTGLDQAELERKIRLLTLASLTSRKLARRSHTHKLQVRCRYQSRMLRNGSSRVRGKGCDYLEHI
jgi:hypothetical protein